MVHISMGSGSPKRGLHCKLITCIFFLGTPAVLTFITLTGFYSQLVIVRLRETSHVKFYNALESKLRV